MLNLVLQARTPVNLYMQTVQKNVIKEQETKKSKIDFMRKTREAFYREKNKDYMPGSQSSFLNLNCNESVQNL